MIFFIEFERPLSGKADIRDLFASPMTAGLLRELVLQKSRGHGDLLVTQEM